MISVRTRKCLYLMAFERKPRGREPIARSAFTSAPLAIVQSRTTLTRSRLEALKANIDSKARLRGAEPGFLKQKAATVQSLKTSGATTSTRGE